MTQFRYSHALGALEDSLVAALQLEPLRLQIPEPEAFRGRWKGHEIRMSFAAWSGPKVAIARSVRLEGHELEIANLVAVARRPLDVPILGIDLVSARPDAGLVVADLSPLDHAGCQLPELPEWAQAIFSADPVFARVTPDTAPAALTRVDALCHRFAQLAAHGRPHQSPETRDAAVARYRDMHLRDDRMRAMLTNMFGDDAATALMSGVLFPPELMDHVSA